MRFFVFIMITTSMLFAYQKGDSVDISVQKQLGMDEKKIYVVDFFASWCNSCKIEIPLISKAEELVDKEKVEIIGVDIDKDIEKGIAFQKSLKVKKALTFRVVNDVENKIVAAFSPVAMPALYIIKKGIVVDSIIGAKDGIDSVLLEKLQGLY